MEMEMEIEMACQVLGFARSSSGEAQSHLSSCGRV